MAAFVVFGLGMQLTAFLPWNWIAGVISVVWIVALVNSFNMLDNMDGLSGGVAAIAATMLAIMLLSTPAQPQIFVAAMLLVLVGGLLGFLVHNWTPAKIFIVTLVMAVRLFPEKYVPRSSRLVLNQHFDYLAT